MLRILFMGTPDFATACLAKLVDNGENVVGVFTKPDKAQGRGMKTAYSDVKKYALKKQLKIFQPETLKDGAVQSILDELKPDVIAVVAYGKLLPGYVLDYPKYGCINVHGSLLPKYRGAAPIQRAVINGERYTGVATMFMDRGLDTGDIIESMSYEIGENQTTGEVFDALASIGSQLLLSTLNKLEKGQVNPVKQDDSLATYAEKITSEECKINFDTEAHIVHNKIRGLSPFPGAYCLHNGKLLKVYESRVCEENDGKAGNVFRLTKDEIYVSCKQGSVVLTKLKPEGKGVMSAKDLINGRKIAVGDVLE